MASWTSREAQPLTVESLRALFDNEIPAIRIAEFATPGECRAFAAAMRRCEPRIVQGATDHSSPAFQSQPIVFIGLTQYEFKYRPMADYLDAADASRAEVAPVLAGSFDPVERLMARLRDLTGDDVGIARDPGGRSYASAMIRNSNAGLSLHADFAPYQAPRLVVSACDAQLAWNFYAEVPDGPGGHTTIHNSPWHWERQSEGEVAENYPLDPAQVAGADHFTFRPEEGDIVLFNSRNPHEVFRVEDPAGKDRIGLATFIARMPSGALRLWS